MKASRTRVLRSHAFLLCGVLLAGGLTGSASAQSGAPNGPQVPNYDSGNAVREARPPPQPGAPAPQAPAPVVAPRAEEPVVLPAEGALFVHDFAFEDADDIPESELQAALEPYKGQNLSLAEIQEAAGKITVLYRTRGYLVAQAYVPPQDARGGTVRIRVLVGRYGHFSIKNQSRVADWLIDEAFSRLARSGSPVRLTDLERSMLLVGDTPGARVPLLTISPGQAAGTSDFQVEVPAANLWKAYVVGDNNGSPYTGTNRLSGGLELSLPLGIGDKLGGNVLASERGGLVAARLAYAAPVVSTGLRAELAAGITTYELTGAYRDLGATGSARTWEGTLSLPIVRTRTRNLYLAFNASYRRLRDVVAAVGSTNTRTIVVGALTPRYEAWETVFDRTIYVNANIAWVEGNLAFANAAQEAFNLAGANTLGNYVYVKINASGQVELVPGLGLNLAISAQQSLGRNLDASEQMLLSGPSGVRAYRTIISGDNGYLVRADLSYALWVPDFLAGKLTHSVEAFADVGGVHLEHDAYSDFKGAQLNDVGAGYAVRYGLLFGSVQLARALGRRPQSTWTERRERWLLQIGASI